MTSNCSKPIGVLTRTKFFGSDERLSIGYSLPDFLPNRSNFFLPKIKFLSKSLWNENLDNKICQLQIALNP